MDNNDGNTSGPYAHLPRFHVGIDCIILGVRGGRLGVLLIRRDFEPERGKLSLIGGFVHRDESVDESARRVLRQLTGLDNIYIRQLGTFGDVDRDPGDRVVSVAYFALLDVSELDSRETERHGAEWFDVNDLPVLGFDHNAMIKMALDKVRSHILSDGLAFNLLPGEFTLTQLQSLVETVTGRKLDKRNFRKRITDDPCIEATEQIDKSTSRRGARLYRHITNKTLHKDA